MRAPRATARPIRGPLRQRNARAARSGRSTRWPSPNLAFAEELYFQFLRDPASVDPEWRRTFAALDGGAGRNGAGAGRAGPAGGLPAQHLRRARGASAADGPPASAPGAIQSRISVRLLSERVQRLVEGYRELGHLFADLDPLGLDQARRARSIALQDYGLTDEDLDLVFSSENVAGPDAQDAARSGRACCARPTAARSACRPRTCTTSSCAAWLQNRMESTRNRLPLTRADRIQVFRAGHRRRGVRAVPAEQVPRARSASRSRGRRASSRCSSGWSSGRRARTSARS